jgi:hypothetical protein
LTDVGTRDSSSSIHIVVGASDVPCDAGNLAEADGVRRR